MEVRSLVHREVKGYDTVDIALRIATPEEREYVFHILASAAKKFFPKDRTVERSGNSHCTYHDSGIGPFRRRKELSCKEGDSEMNLSASLPAEGMAYLLDALCIQPKPKLESHAAFALRDIVKRYNAKYAANEKA